MKVYLIGYMGVGKSTLGKKLAKKLGLQFIDLDSFIEQQEGDSILNIVNLRGEAYFRTLELEALQVVSRLQNVMISTGGGTPCFGENMTLMKNSGVVVFLQMNVASIFQRLINAKQSRPLIAQLQQDDLERFIQKQLSERNLFYTQAHVIWDALKNNSQDLDALALEIKRLV